MTKRKSIKTKAAQNHAAMPVKKRFILLLLSVIAAVLGTAAVAVSTLSETDFKQVAAVNGEPIAARELETQMKRLKPDVQNYFRVQYDARINADFWSGDFNGENPMKILRERALDEAVRRKIELLLAKEHNLVDFSSYKDMLNQLEIENGRRKSAIAKGEVVYGPGAYSESEYYNHIMSNLRLNLKDLLSRSDKDLFFVTENEARSSYLDNEDRWSSKDVSYKILKISIPYRTQEHMEDAYSKAQNALADLDKGMSFDDASKKYNESSKILTQTFNQDSYRSDVRSAFNLRSAAESLQINEYSKEILEDNGSYNLIMLTSKENGEPEAYAQNKNAVKSMVIDEKYEAYIKELIKKAEIKINEKNYNKTTF
ncbi:hypothetical protein ACFOLF_14145 [Paenibacillus sepulcri]|uniref:peptidylprolyl isomerase n=1 Tax=Paenibacillus sepulcri TaxID=359917 RepID=A0ABS7BXS9_9BACL|nr:hypothetical protein [Paenibacillus sepulcri]